MKEVSDFGMHQIGVQSRNAQQDKPYAKNAEIEILESMLLKNDRLTNCEHKNSTSETLQSEQSKFLIREMKKK